MERKEAPTGDPELAPLVAQAISAVRETANLRPTGDREDLDNIKTVLGQLHEFTRLALQRVLRARKFPKDLPLEEGRQEARNANRLVGTYGFRPRIPNSDAPGTLSYNAVGSRLPDDSRSPVFVVAGLVEGRHTTRTIGCDFSRIDLIPATPLGTARPSTSRRAKHTDY